MNEFFRRAARTASSVLGSAWSFIVAILIVVIWAGTGPLFHYSDTWQLVINTGTTIITFLMVFLIQNTQNRDSKAIHLKLDELIYAIKEARSGLVVLEERSDAELEELEKEFRHVARREAEAVVHDEIDEINETESEKVEPRKVRAAKKDASA